MSFAATSLNERQRFHREEATRWSSQKLDAYLEYLYAVKHMARIARCIAAARGINPDQPPLEREDALLLLSEAEEKRAQATEKVTLLGNEATVNAVRDLNKEVWRLEKIASGGLTPDLESWLACNRSLVDAKNKVHQEIRVELGIPGKVPAQRPCTAIRSEAPRTSRRGVGRKLRSSLSVRVISWDISWEARDDRHADPRRAG